MHAGSLSRRRWLMQSTAALGTIAAHDWLDVCRAIAADEPIPRSASLNRFPRMMQEYFVREVREIERRSTERLAHLKTKAEAEAHLLGIRRRIGESFGPWPERTPLNPRVTGIVERDTYRIEKVIFESRPGFFVTANLYVPRHGKLPAPGIIGSCGHSDTGKTHESYQSFSQGLARLGYVVLIFDPIGQGERLQLPDETLKSRLKPGVAEHLMVGNQQFLVGEFFGSWRAWDGIRALDYLLTREEVDPRHVGITGNSGGGTMTTWLCGVEPRWTMAAPSCFVTTFRRNLENELPADTEQCPPRALALGLDHADFLAALAPKPIILLAQERDYFDVRGTLEAHARLRKLYSLLGTSPDDVGLHIGPGAHGFANDAREAMYGWFNRATRLGDSSKEPMLQIEEERTLWCTRSGQVTELSSRTVGDFTRAAAERFARERGALAGNDLRKAVEETLRLPPRNAVPDYRILRPRVASDYPLPHVSQYAVETESGITVPVYRLSKTVLSSRPPKESNRALLYVAHDSSDAELRNETLVRERFDADPSATFYACDVRGLGESRPNTCGENTYDAPYGCDYFYAAHGIMLDRSYVSARTHDLLGVLDWLSDIGHPEVHLVALGYGTIPAAFAALLSDRVTQVTLKHVLTSFHDVASSEIHDWPLSSFVPGVLKRFDLPDVYRALAAKGLRLIEPWDARRRVVSS